MWKKRYRKPTVLIINGSYIFCFHFRIVLYISQPRNPLVFFSARSNRICKSWNLCQIIKGFSHTCTFFLIPYFNWIYFWNFQQAPGIPKVLIGNRLHLAFKRQVSGRDAEAYAEKNRMAFFEVSPLCDFNVKESFSELSRMALSRNGMERLWRSNKGIFSHSLIYTR